jgi:hypothetical protein
MRLPTPLRLISLYGQSLDPPSGDVLKDEGIRTCLKNAHPVWVAGWNEIVQAYPEGWTGTGEDIRFDVTRKLRLLPHSKNCWGSMVTAAMSDGVLEFKRPWELRRMTDPISHSRLTPVLRRTGLL